MFLRSLPTLRVMADDEFSPLSHWNAPQGQYEGVAIELFQTVATRLGLKYEFFHDSALTWDQKLEFFLAAQADVLMPVSQTYERAKNGLFSVSYFETSYAAIAPTSLHRQLDGVRGLSAWRVGVVKSSAIVPYVHSVVPASQVVLVDSTQELYQALREGRIDFALQNYLVFQEDRYSQELFDLVVVRNMVEWPRRYSFYFPKNSVYEKLVPLVDRVLATIDVGPMRARYETGVETLILRYTEQKHRQDLLLVTLVASLVGLVLLVVLLWNQRRLKASEARFRALSEASFGGIAIHEDGRILECNQGLSDMFGFPRKQLLGSNGLMLIAPAHRDLVLANIRSGFSPTYEVEGLRQDGSLFPMGVRGKNIPYQGRPVRVTEFFDLTDQKDAEAATRRAKQRYDALVAKIPVGVYVLRSHSDGSARFDFLSPRMAQMLGVGVEETLRDMHLAFRAIHPNDRPAMEALNRESILYLRPFAWTGRALAEGELRWFHISSEPEVQDSGEVLWHGLVVDITAQKRAEERNRLLLEEKDLILKEVHHRIKNHMSTVTGLLTLQAARLEDPVAIAALEDTKSRVLSMMLLYDKLYLSEGLGLSLAAYLPALVTQVLDNFPNAALVEAETRAEDIEVDARTLSSVGIIVNELLTNGMKYAFATGARGRILVTAEKTGHQVRLVVEDDGRGLPEGFDRGQSTGFGLSLVEMLTRHLEGTLVIERGNGTRFVLEFPLPDQVPLGK